MVSGGNCCEGAGPSGHSGSHIGGQFGRPLYSVSHKQPSRGDGCAETYCQGLTAKQLASLPVFFYAAHFILLLQPPIFLALHGAPS